MSLYLLLLIAAIIAAGAFVYCWIDTGTLNNGASPVYLLTFVVAAYLALS